MRKWDPLRAFCLREALGWSSKQTTLHKPSQPAGLCHSACADLLPGVSSRSPRGRWGSWWLTLQNRWLVATEDQCMKASQPAYLTWKVMYPGSYTRRIPGHPWSSLRVRRGETLTWDLLSTRLLFSHPCVPVIHTWFLWCGGPPHPYKVSALGHTPQRRLRLQPPLQRVTAAAEEPALGQPTAAAVASGAQFCSGRSQSVRQHPSIRKNILYFINVLYLKACTIFSL